MIVVMPLIAAFALVSFDPERWGGSFSIQNILMIAFFGMITIPLWITYIPSLFIVPMIMHKLSTYDSFHSISIWKFIVFSLIGGGGLGIFILFPCIIISLSDSYKLLLNWLIAGVSSGAITLTLISFLYRMHK